MCFMKRVIKRFCFPRINIHQRMNIIERIHEEMRINLIFQILQFRLQTLMFQFLQHFFITERFKEKFDGDIEPYHQKGNEA